MLFALPTIENLPAVRILASKPCQFPCSAETLKIVTALHFSLAIPYSSPKIGGSWCISQTEIDHHGGHVFFCLLLFFVLEDLIMNTASKSSLILYFKKRSIAIPLHSEVVDRALYDPTFDALLLIKGLP